MRLRGSERSCAASGGGDSERDTQSGAGGFLSPQRERGRPGGNLTKLEIAASVRHRFVHYRRLCSAWPRPDTRSRDTFTGDVMRCAAVARRRTCINRETRVGRVILRLYRPITRRSATFSRGIHIMRISNLAIIPDRFTLRVLTLGSVGTT